MFLQIAYLRQSMAWHDSSCKRTGVTLYISMQCSHTIPHASSHTARACRRVTHMHVRCWRQAMQQVLTPHSLRPCIAARPLLQLSWMAQHTCTQHIDLSECASSSWTPQTSRSRNPATLRPGTRSRSAASRRLQRIELPGSAREKNEGLNYSFSNNLHSAAPHDRTCSHLHQ